MSLRPLRAAGVVLWALISAACRSKEPERSEERKVASSAPRSSTAQSTGPQLLYLPDGGDQVQNEGRLELPAPLAAPLLGGGACPLEMVSVRGEFCVDRYEASLVDKQARALSPYYPPSHQDLLHTLRLFRDLAARARERPAPRLPLPPDFSQQAEFEPVAQSVAAVVPSGYMSGVMAKRACEGAGKRLCSPSEWVLACRGEQGTKFPYGESYEDGTCNVFREAHPAVVLHGDASKHHLDPRLNLAEGRNGPLLRHTGATPSCKSRWGADAAYDMVGNLDEWVESESGMFQGGFYARGTREGCEARITSHPTQYFDYSLGVRCCK